jgi:hypothetical protein
MTKLTLRVRYCASKKETLAHFWVHHNKLSTPSLYWGYSPRPREKFHAANEKAQHALKVPWFFFLLSFGGLSGERISFIFPVFLTCSLQVPNGFPIWGEGFFSFSSGSQGVPTRFSSGSQYVPQVLSVFPNMLSITPHFNPICFGKRCPPFTYCSTFSVFSKIILFLKMLKLKKLKSLLAKNKKTIVCWSRNLFTYAFYGRDNAALQRIALFCRMVLNFFLFLILCMQ